MPSLTDLGPGAVAKASPELLEATVRDDATAVGQEVRCRRARAPVGTATDPMPWTAVVTPAGFFYPKSGDRAVLGYPIDGPPFIAAYWPAADAVADAPLS